MGCSKRVINTLVLPEFDPRTINSRLHPHPQPNAMFPKPTGDWMMVMGGDCFYTVTFHYGEFGEKAAALAITDIGMDVRRRSKRGFWLRRQKKGGIIGFRRAAARAQHWIKGTKDVLKTTKIALDAIGSAKVRVPKGSVLKTPKTGGILPLIPIFSALGC